MTLVVPPASDPSADSSVASAVSRLAEEFSDRLRPQLIVRVVRDCRRDLGGSPVGAMPELVERLARIRLQESIA
ncbi:three-helix bundle dimerization domain-containing protein [Blastococcus sp. SYSU D00669]